MQTLPFAMQTNILSFLTVEHRRFHAKDLEMLARCILSSSDLNFWLSQAATTLLSTSSELLGSCLPTSSKDKCTIAGLDDYDALPDWLDNQRERWLPFEKMSLSLEALQREQKGQKIDGNVFSQFAGQLDKPGSSNHSLKANADNLGIEDSIVDNIKFSETQESLKERAKMQPNDKNPNDEHMEGVALEVDSMDVSDTGMKNLASKEEMTARADLGDEMFLQATTLRQILHSSVVDGLPEKLGFIRLIPKLSTFLSVVEAWRVKDEVTLVLVGSLLTEQDGYAWSTQILKSVLLPKLFQLEKPGSRLLMTAIAQAGKSHPRATMEAVVFPLICSENGASNIQCEVINRVIKDCLPEEVVLSLCEKMFPSLDGKSYNAISKTSWVWTEGMITVVHNLLSYKLNLDQQIITGLVFNLDDAMTEFSTSLKFGNLLLNFFTKYAPKLKSHKTILQHIASKSNTFLTKSLLTKVSSL